MNASRKWETSETGHANIFCVVHPLSQNFLPLCAIYLCVPSELWMLLGIDPSSYQVAGGMSGLLELPDPSPLPVSSLICWPQCACHTLSSMNARSRGLGENTLTSKVNLLKTATIVLFTKGNTSNKMLWEGYVRNVKKWVMISQFSKKRKGVWENLARLLGWSWSRTGRATCLQEWIFCVQTEGGDGPLNQSKYLLFASVECPLFFTASIFLNIIFNWSFSLIILFL